MSLLIIRSIADDIQKADYFTIMIDECTNHEQLVLCIRWVGENLEVHEEFIGHS